MRVQLWLFSTLRDCLPGGARQGSASVELPEGSTLADLIARLGIDRRLNCKAEELVSPAGWQVLVNGCFEPEMRRALRDGDGVQIFPPVAGGRATGRVPAGDTTLGSGRLCAWLAEISRSDTAIAGGKGANLGEMARAGLPVPPGFVVCSPAFQHTMERAGVDLRVRALVSGLDRDDFDRLQAVERQARRLVEDAPIPAELREAVLDSYRALGDRVPVAVRSSATAEDCVGASFAGQQETLLNVSGDEPLLEAIVRSWSSLFTARAIFYRIQSGFDACRVSMAVVVQQLIDCEKSGVLFTVDPVLRNRYQMVIEAVWGLGEGIVSGAITPDHYQLDRDDYELISEFVPRKRLMVVRSDCGGIKTAEVPEEAAAGRVLSDDELRRLVDLGNRVERHFGCPQDVEWGIAGGEVYLLQSRPITCL